MLSRTEASRTEASTALVGRVDLVSKVQERIAHWPPLAQESRVQVRYEEPPTAPVMAVPTAPKQIIDNFVDNALSASPDGATITVSIVRAGPDTILHVLDDGPGFSEDERNRGFDRFWRTTSNKEGNGLGLAIVAQLALASGAEACLAPRPQGGLDASV